MATLTPTQLSNLRADLGDTGGTPAFSDPELQALWDRLTDAPNETVQHEATLALAFRQLMVQASKFHNYTAGQVTENLQQVRDNLEANFELFKPALDAATSQNRQLVIGKLGKRDKRERTRPYEDFDVSVNRINTP
jgi:hypothetical protein